MGRLLWGDAFIPAIAVLRCLSPLPVLFALVNVIGIQTMLVFEMDARLSRVLLLCSAVNIPLAAVLSGSMGALGAASATVGTALLTVLSLAWGVRRHRVVLWRVISEDTCAP